MFDVKVELSSLLENGSGNISHQKGMEMDLNLDTMHRIRWYTMEDGRSIKQTKKKTKTIS